MLFVMATSVLNQLLITASISLLLEMQISAAAAAAAGHPVEGLLTAHGLP
jgi:hypothetical protein